MRFPLAVPLRPATRQRGAGMAGFLLTALPVLLLGAGAIETAHWLFLRQTLSHALVEAGRAAATRHAQPAALARAFEDALRMLHPEIRQRDAALAWRRRALDGPPWRIRVIRPARAAFLDHADPGTGAPPAGALGPAQIRNDRQHEQHQRAMRMGWPAGRGPVSGETVFEANTLQLELIWPHRPLLPGVAAVLRLMAESASPEDDRRRVLTQGLLPIVRSATLAMHSHPAQWPDLADGRVVHGNPASGPPSAAGPDCAHGPNACLPHGSPPGAADGGTAGEAGHGVPPAVPDGTAAGPPYDPAASRPDGSHADGRGNAGIEAGDAAPGDLSCDPPLP